ncbi:MAG: hypothetical protein PHQ72_12215 [Hespellia sp.]|nr:hypothetical protein [Hespellia sp.]
MKKWKQIGVIAVAAVMAFAMCACGAKDFDAQGYVKAALDANYHGEYEEYAKFRNIDVDKAEAEVADTYASVFAETAIGGTDEEEKQFQDDMMKCYALTKYEVGEATKTDDGNYTVTVTYEPATALADFSTGMQGYLEENMDSVTQDNYASYVLQYLEQCITDNTFGEKATMDITVQLDKDAKEYTIPDEQVQALESAMLGI